jgi:hypothetical protein
VSASPPVDYNWDGLLEIAACLKASPKLYRQRANRRFTDVSRPLRKSRVEGTAARGWTSTAGAGR